MKIRLFLLCVSIAGVCAFPKFANKDDESTCGYSVIVFFLNVQ